MTSVGEVDDIGLLAQVLNCRIAALPTTYLEVSLGAAMWNPLVQRVEKRLARWHKRYLSKSRKKVLIKNTLSSFPRITCPCFMLQFLLLSWEKIRVIPYGMWRIDQRNFTWCGGRLSHLLKNGEVLELRI